MNRDQLSDDEIRDAVVRAFRPLRCVAEIWDYDKKLRFLVFDTKDEGILRIPDLVLRALRDRSNLRSVLLSARAVLEEKGFQLEPLDI